MRNKFFVRNLLRMAVIALIPLIVMGLFSISITYRYIADRNRNIGEEALGQVHESINNLFLEVRNLDAGISTNYNIQTALRRILTNPSTSYQDHLILDLIGSNLTAKAKSNPMIYSLYIYYRNESNRFITSDRYIAKTEGFYDGAWFDHYRADTGAPVYWSLPRTIRQTYGYGEDIEVVTYFRNMYFDGGTIVANICVEETNRLLTQLVSASPQFLAVMDKDHNLLFRCADFMSVPESVRAQIPAEEGAVRVFDEQHRRYRIFKSYSKETGLYYLSFIPESEVNALPRQITQLTLAVLVATLGVAMLFAYRVAQQSYASLHNIFQLIEASTSGKPLPEIVQGDDIYGNIASNIVRNFIERDYLMEQLSKNKYQAQALELMALQSQMNPHFLFNTLDTIYWRTLALTRRPNEATELIEWLSDMLKYSLRGEHSTVRMVEEIANTKNYINIQRIRYRDCFHVNWEVDEEAQHLPILKMLLQPLVENCLTHAMVKERPLLIRIRIRGPEEGRVRITVTDNGRGIERERLRDIREKLACGYTTESHIGMFNTNKRVMLSYAGEAEFTVHSRLNLGTRMRIDIPAAPEALAAPLRATPEAQDALEALHSGG